MNDYCQQLKRHNVTVLEDYKGAKQHHNVRCDVCNHEWVSTLVSIKQLIRKHGTNGCIKCKHERLYNEKRQDVIKQINERFTILSDYDGQQTTTQTITVRSKKCNHVFNSAPGNLIHRDVECPVCNIEKKRQTLQQCNEERSRIYQETADEWGLYRHEVYRLTRISYKHHKSTINPFDLPRGKAGQRGAYHLDHIIPVRYCFEHNIPAEVCAHFDNLQMIPWSANITEGCKIKENTDIPKIFEPFIKPVD